MNDSRKTAIIALGLARHAAVMDLSEADQSAEDWAIRHEWQAWSEAYPQWVDFVKKEHWQLFSKVNNALWPRI